MMQIRKAERGQSKLRIGLSSPSGAGKTYSSLLLAKGLVGDWNKIGMIDSENGRGDIYSDLGTYNIVTLKAPFSPEKYIEAIRAFETFGVEVIIIDSMSHEWEGEGGCLQLNEKLAIAKYKGNTWSAWSETGERHQKLLNAIVSSECHVITTVRNKIDTVMVDGKVKKVGIKEITREGFEFELTVNFNIDRDSHTVIASKDNTRLFEGKDPFVITEDTGKELKDWVSSGKADETQERKTELKDGIMLIVKRIKKDRKWLEDQVGPINNLTLEELEKLEKKVLVAEKKMIAIAESKKDPLSKAMTNSIVKNKKDEK